MSVFDMLRPDPYPAISQIQNLVLSAYAPTTAALGSTWGAITNWGQVTAELPAKLASFDTSTGVITFVRQPREALYGLMAQCGVEFSSGVGTTSAQFRLAADNGGYALHQSALAQVSISSTFLRGQMSIATAISIDPSSGPINYRLEVQAGAASPVINRLVNETELFVTRLA